MGRDDSARSPSRVGPARWVRPAVLVALAGGLTALTFLALFLGTPALSADTVLSILAHEVLGGRLAGSPCGSSALSPVTCNAYVDIVWNTWMPEVLLALFAGAALGLSGATLQGVFRNPLADPYLLGVSSGAAFGAALLFVLGIGQAEANLALPLFAFLGAMATGLVIIAAARSPRSTPEVLLLTGVAMSAFLSSILVVTLLYSPIGSLQLNFWILGGVFGADWGRVGILAGGVLAAGALLVLYVRPLNILQLGPEVAQSLGVDARRTISSSILLASFLTALAVAFSGVIGFVGLVAPHLVRRIFGYDYRRVLPLSALAGAILLAGAFDTTQYLLRWIELPLGVPMAFVGGPFFVYLLYRRRSGGEATP